MCGRFTLTAPAEFLAETFPDVQIPDDLVPRYNIAPTQDVAAIPNTGEGRVERYRWGLVPAWAKDPGMGNRMINARGETVQEKPAFRGLLRRRRCLVLADGFYEWQPSAEGKGKTPILVRLISGRPFAFAGLWDVWEPPDAPPIHSCTIITTTANERLRGIHDRMPVIVRPDAYGAWLTPGEQPGAGPASLLVPYPSSEMTAYPVSTMVNNPANASPACIEAA